MGMQLHRSTGQEPALSTQPLEQYELQLASQKKVKRYKMGLRFLLMDQSVLSASVCPKPSVQYGSQNKRGSLGLLYIHRGIPAKQRSGIGFKVGSDPRALKPLPVTKRQGLSQTSPRPEQRKQRTEPAPCRAPWSSSWCLTSQAQPCSLPTASTGEEEG